jgi:glycosyltransferase involved in cell wall biosynthesis
VSDAPGNRDAVVDGVTGYVCQSVEEMMERCRRLVDDPELRQQMGVRALEWSRQNLTDDQIGVDSLNIYESASVTGGRPPRSIT